MVSLLVSSAFVFFVAFMCAGGIRLYFSFKAFIGNVFDKSLPVELIEKIIEPLTPWKKWFAKNALLFGRTKLNEKVFKVLTAPDTIIGALIKIGIFLVAGVFLAGLNVLIWYFGDVSPYVIVSATLAGLVTGYFVHRATVDKLLDYLVIQISGVSVKVIKDTSERLGIELMDDISSSQNVSAAQ